MKEGMKMAAQVIDSKAALKKLEDLREYSKRFA
jgi:anthranilate phosphoribosyltransferase